MDFYCDHCGFHMRFGLGMAPVYPRTCHVCGIGLMLPGTADSGFLIDQDVMHPFGQDVPPLKIRRTNGSKPVSQLDYFANETGDEYMKFIQTKTVYLGDFNNYLMADTEQFAWLSPYTGNKHNQRYFTQAALAKVAIAQFQGNGGVFPRLIEPFVGSGQVFLNACCWGPSFNQGIPLLHEVIGGDLNPYVVATYQVMRQVGMKFVAGYLKFAAMWDADVAQSFDDRKNWLAEHGKAEATGTVLYGKAFAAMSYMYVVNRCVHGSKLTAAMGVQTSQRGGLNAKALEEIRTHESDRLKRVVAMLSTLGSATFACQDFELTCNLAKPTDVVFMDCPFPNFTKFIPKPSVQNPEIASQSANTYGVGDDGGELQTRIVTVTRRLIQQGTTVVLCNFANAGLIRAYTNLLWQDTGIPAEFRRWFTFTYCSPARTSEAYLLTILPGRGKRQVNDVPLHLRSMWQHVSPGDDNFGEPGQQQFFFDVKVKAAEEPVHQDWGSIAVTGLGLKRKADDHAGEQPGDWTSGKGTPAKKLKAEAAREDEGYDEFDNDAFDNGDDVLLLDANELALLDAEIPLDTAEDVGNVADAVPVGATAVPTKDTASEGMNLDSGS